jgi:sarcosine oxidase subunit delta
MLLIPCPWCGSRDESEFAYGGDATGAMPPMDLTSGTEDWHRFVHQRGNPAGLHAEYWHHTSGCERWLVVERDTQSHEIASCRDGGAPD